MNADDVIRVCNAVVRGVKKEDSPVPLDAELSALWDQLASSDNDGYAYEMPHELPAIETPAPVTDWAAEFWNRLPRLRAGEHLEMHLRSNQRVVVTAVSSGLLDVRTMRDGDPRSGVTGTFARHEMSKFRELLEPLLHDNTVRSVVHVDGSGQRHVIGDPEAAPGEIDGIVDRHNVPLDVQLVTFLASMMHCAPDDLPRDSDGDLYIRTGTTVVFIRPSQEPESINIFSVVLVDVLPAPDLFMRLASMSAASPIAWSYSEGAVIAKYVQLAWPFIGNHLDTAIRLMFEQVNRFAAPLREAFGGSPFLTPESQEPQVSDAADDAPQGEV